MVSVISYVETMLPIMPPCSSWHMITFKPVESIRQSTEGRYGKLAEVGCGVKLLDELVSMGLELAWLELMGASLDEIVCASLEDVAADSV